MMTFLETAAMVRYKSKKRDCMQEETLEDCCFLIRMVPFAFLLRQYASTAAKRTIPRTNKKV